MTAPIVEQFREGLARGTLLLQHCNACGRLNMYPRYACPHCQSDDLGWQEASGKGRLMSYTILRGGAPEGFEGELPYALGVVRVEEGVQLLARLSPGTDGGWDGYACDRPVMFVPTPDRSYAVFAAAEAAHG